MIVGITGGIGSGKSTVERMFAELGVPTTNADDIGKDILDNNTLVKSQILQKYQVYRDDDQTKIDRKKLRRLIFNSDTDRVWLEQLLHPIIKSKIKEFATQSLAPYCIVEIPLLYEAQWQDCVDRILIVDVPEDVQKTRTSLRDQISHQEVEKIMATQLTRAERIANTADIISNIHSIDSLRQEVVKLHTKYLNVALKS